MAGVVVITVFVLVTLALVDPHVRFNGGSKISAWLNCLLLLVTVDFIL